MDNNRFILKIYNKEFKLDFLKQYDNDKTYTTYLKALRTLGDYEKSLNPMKDLCDFSD